MLAGLTRDEHFATGGTVVEHMLTNTVGSSTAVVKYENPDRSVNVRKQGSQVCVQSIPQPVLTSRARLTW
jgi:hypothetical protein